MNLNLEKLSFGDWLRRKLSGHRKIYWEQDGGRKKLTKDELGVDITIWNIVHESIPTTDENSPYAYDMRSYHFGVLKVEVTKKLENIRKVYIKDVGFVAISHATAHAILHKLKMQKHDQEEEERKKKNEQIKESLYNGYLESKGL